MFYTLDQLASRLDASFVQISDGEDRNALQDVLGRNSLGTLAAFVSKLADRQRRNFSFVVNTVMDADSAWTILEMTIFAAKIEERVAARTKALGEKCAKLVAEREDLELEQSALRCSLDSSLFYLSETEKQVTELCAENEALQAKVKQLSEAMADQNSRVTAFRLALANLIQP